ncbi:hypothetical protein STEG23_023450 [Scotinomys teguina]
MQPGQTTNSAGGTMEVVAAAPRCQLLLIMLMAAMLLPGMKGSPLLVQRTVTRTFELQESIGKVEKLSDLSLISSVSSEKVISCLVQQKFLKDVLQSPLFELSSKKINCPHANKFDDVILSILQVDDLLYLKFTFTRKNGSPREKIY